MFYVSRTKFLPKLAEVLIAAHINLNDNIRYITCFFFFVVVVVFNQENQEIPYLH